MPPSMVAHPVRIHLEPLTQSSFTPFGTVIENPLGPLPAETSDTPLPALPANAVLANQGTAIKHLDVSKLTDYYATAPSKTPAAPVMNMFSCTARALRDEQTGQRIAGPVSARQTLLAEGVRKVTAVLDVRILERHPFTPQTFVPVGLDAADAGSCYIVIVAPTVAGTGGTAAKSWMSFLPGMGRTTADEEQPGGSGPPDVSRLRAFLARGSQAVTYAAGTWHAPMIVLGERGVDFVVVQFANGVANEDCQEMLLAPATGQKHGPRVIVELPGESIAQGSQSLRKTPQSKL